MKQTIEDKRLAVLEDMVKYYSKAPVSRRCVENGQCSYHPDTANKPKSEGCAVGRMLPRALAKKLDNKFGRKGGVPVHYLFSLHNKGEIKLSKKVLDLGESFLSNLQKLHDDGYTWTKRGLSSNGKKKVEIIEYNIRSGFYL